LIVSPSVLLRTRNVSDKVVEKIKTHILGSKLFFENRAVYEITWKNTVQPGRPQMTIWPMCIARWIHKATNTHSEYVTLIDFPLHNSCTKALRYTYIACLVSLHKERVKYLSVHTGRRNGVTLLTITVTP
jgi:hypothetical protein